MVPQKYVGTMVSVGSLLLGILKASLASNCVPQVLGELQTLLISLSSPFSDQ
jgi:hypothetical protein